MFEYSVIGVVRGTLEPIGSCVTIDGRFGSKAAGVVNVLENGGDR